MSFQSLQAQLSKKKGMKKIDYTHGLYREHIIQWLEQNPEDRNNLFSDNIKNANAEGWQMKNGRHPKQYYYAKITKSVFENNETHKDDYSADSVKFVKSIENHVQR